MTIPSRSRSRLGVGLLSVLVGPAAAGCIFGPQPVIARNVADGDYCASPQRELRPARKLPPEAPTLPGSPATTHGYSARALDTARAIGALAIVERLVEAEERNAVEAELVDLRGQLNDAIALATLDLSSTAANIQCEEGRAGQIATDLRDAEQEQTKNLTAYSLVISAAGAISAGVLSLTHRDDPTPAAVVGIGGGVAGAGFGLGTLAVHRTTIYRHPRNLLGQLWFGGEHPDFPEIVWAYLTRPQFTKSGQGSMREVLVSSWKESGRLGDDLAHPSDERVALYFGDGGTYDADRLDDRADMLSEVREAIGLMNHDLQLLATEAVHR